jgi:hypothetical protein
MCSTSTDLTTTVGRPYTRCIAPGQTFGCPDPGADVEEVTFRFPTRLREAVISLTEPGRLALSRHVAALRERLAHVE